MSETVLELAGIRKRYPGVVALDGVDLQVRAGEVTALLGENGAGKSTLIKIMAGVETADEGSYLVDGAPVRISSPRDARELGVAVVFQELNQVESMSVAENLFFGRLPRGPGGLVDRRELRARARDHLQAVGLDVDPGMRLGYLSVAERQLVEIAGALSQNARVIAMDEPTSALSHTEIETLFGLVDQLRDSGVGIVYVSHKLDELHRLADRITVLRDGRYVDTVRTSETDDAELIRLMVGRELTTQFPPRPEAAVADDGPAALEVVGLTTTAVHDVTFSVRAGEVVGFSGLMGSGRTELARAIFGLDRSTRGVVRVGGRAVRPGSPEAAVGAGIGYVPEDRKGAGLVLTGSIRANMTLAVMRLLSRLGFVDQARERAAVEAMIADLRVKAVDGDQRVATLSGGNQQKVTLGRWLLKDDLRVLLLDEPTRGIDVNAKAEIYRLVAAVAERGVAVVVFSSEMPEILGLCDRVHVMRGGHVVAEHGVGVTQEQLMESALGGTS